MENQSKFKTSKDIIRYLAATFPHCFSIEGEAKPLKIGIFHDLVKRLDTNNSGISKVKLRAALRSYTLSWRYLYGIKENASRVDLDGNPCHKLSAEHVAHAQQKLKEGKEKVKARKQQERKENKIVNKSNSHDNHGNKPANIQALNRPDKKPTPSQNHDPVCAKTKKVKPTLCAVDISTLRIGDEVKINLSSKPVKAILIAIEKENVRVKIQSGMELTVKSEYIVE